MLEEYTDKVKESGLEYKVYPNTGLINITDTDGVIQSYYSTTGTAVFRDGKGKYWQVKQHREYNMPFDRFLTLCKGEEDIIETFFD